MPPVVRTHVTGSFDLSASAQSQHSHEEFRATSHDLPVDSPARSTIHGVRPDLTDPFMSRPHVPMLSIHSDID